MECRLLPWTNFIGQQRSCARKNPSDTSSAASNCITLPRPNSTTRPTKASFRSKSIHSQYRNSVDKRVHRRSERDSYDRHETKEATQRYNVIRGIIRTLNASLMLAPTLITTIHAFISFTNQPTIANNVMVASGFTDESTFFTLRCPS